MVKKIEHDYEPELDILHVYFEDIKGGITGCLSIGDFNIDVANNKIVGLELEEASKNLGLSSKILSNPDNVNLVIRKTGNILFMGIGVSKGTVQSSTHVTTLSNRVPMQVTH